MTQTYSAKDSREVIIMSMDFRRLLASGETITSASWSITRTDVAEDTSSMLSGSADYSGDPVVTQVVQGGTNNGYYLHCPTITTNLGQTLVASASQRVILGG